MKKILNILLFLMLYTNSVFAADPSEENSLRGLLQLSNQYINASVERATGLLAENSGNINPNFTGENILSNDGSNPFFEALEISQNYSIKIQFKSINNKSASNSVSYEFQGKRIMLIPLIEREEGSNNLTTIISAWECITDIDNLLNDLVGTKKNYDLLSPVARVSDNKYLNNCVGVSDSYLDSVWSQ